MEIKYALIPSIITSKINNSKFLISEQSFLRIRNFFVCVTPEAEVFRWFFTPLKYLCKPGVLKF